MSSRPRPILIDMPLHIKEKIVHHTDIESRFQLRNCSTEYRNIVDNIPTVYTNISFKRRYRLPGGYEFSVTTGSSSSQFYRNFRCSSSDQVKDLFQKHSSRFLKNRKAKFEQIHIARSHFLRDQLKTVLSSLDHQVAVKSISFKGCNLPKAEWLMSVLPYLEPGYLEHMDLGHMRNNTVLTQIIELEQFKQAKSAVIEGNCLEIPIAKLLHFRRLECNYLSFLSLENVQTIIDSALRHGENFERWVLETFDSDDSIEEHFGSKRTFNVPNSDHRLTFAHNGEIFYLTNEARRLETDIDFL